MTLCGFFFKRILLCTYVCNVSLMLQLFRLVILFLAIIVCGKEEPNNEIIWLLFKVHCIRLFFSCETVLTKHSMNSYNIKTKGIIIHSCTSHLPEPPRDTIAKALNIISEIKLSFMNSTMSSLRGRTLYRYHAWVCGFRIWCDITRIIDNVSLWLS